MSTHTDTTVVRGGSIWTGADGARAHGPSDLVIEDGRIAAIEPSYRGRADIELDAERCLVVPGFTNTHVHPGASPMLRGLAEDLEVPDGAAFYHRTVPLRRHGFEVLSKEELADIIRWDVAAMLLGGATTLVNEDFGDHTVWVELVEKLGFRSSLGLVYPSNIGAIGYVKDGKIMRDAPDDLSGAFARAVAAHDEYHGSADGRLSVHLSPQGADAVPDDLLVETRRVASEREMTIHLHLAQHKQEIETVHARSGKTPTRHLADLGFLGPDVVATHFTYTVEEDWRLLVESGATMVHCAYRKAKEGMTSPLVEILDLGGNVALATDSFSHSMVQDLRIGALLQKIRHSGVGRATAEMMLCCATLGGARALGQAEERGTLEPGRQGDVTVIPIETPFASPAMDPVTSAVYYSDGSAIRHSLVDGKPVVVDGTIRGLDLADLGARVGAACDRVWNSAREAGIIPASGGER